MTKANTFKGLTGNPNEWSSWGPTAEAQGDTYPMLGEQCCLGPLHGGMWLFFLALPILQEKIIFKRNLSVLLSFCCCCWQWIQICLKHCTGQTTCLPVVSSFCFRSVKDQPKHLSQFLKDLHFPILDVSCRLLVFKTAFRRAFVPIPKFALDIFPHFVFFSLQTFISSIFTYRAKRSYTLFKIRVYFCY